MLVKNFCMLVKKFRYVGEIIMLVKIFHQHQGPKNRVNVGEEMLVKSMLVKKFRMLMKKFRILFKIPNSIPSH